MRRLLALAALLTACGPHYHMDTPAGFEPYEDGFRYITADGVMLKGREVDNYPKAELPFWTDALKRHLEARGYAFKDRDCFKTSAGLDGCTLSFLLPFGAEDWQMSETVFVDGNRIILLEAAGPFDRFARVEPGLKTALRTFKPGG
jgi:hypothetical protein